MPSIPNNAPTPANPFERMQVSTTTAASAYEWVTNANITINNNNIVNNAGVVSGDVSGVRNTAFGFGNFPEESFVARMNELYSRTPAEPKKKQTRRGPKETVYSRFLRNGKPNKMHISDLKLLFPKLALASGILMHSQDYSRIAILFTLENYSRFSNENSTFPLYDTATTIREGGKSYVSVPIAKEQKCLDRELPVLTAQV